MKKTYILYWTTTLLFALLMFGSAIPDIISVPMAVEGFRKIGLPAYLLPFVGIAKTLGVIAILLPGYPTVKEWAYAGLTYDLLGGMYSIYSGGETLANWLPMLFPIGLGLTSYYLYHKKLTLQKSNYAQTDRVHEFESGRIPVGSAL